MNKDELTAQHKNDLGKNEREMSEFLSKKRNLEENRHNLNAWKRKNMTFYSQMRSELASEGLKDETKTIDNILDSTSHACRKVERSYEQKYEEIERQRKRLSVQKEDYEINYRRAMQDVDKKRGDVVR